jgi:hypothetical protein
VILHGSKKRVLKEVIRYYVETTEKAYEDFILEVQKSRGEFTDAMPYSEWLALQLFGVLSKHEITLSDCIENKDTIRSAIKEDETRMDGEFYTPEVWCRDGREYLKTMLGDQWGKAYIWDASCGTGNLLRSADYPQDKIFMSSLLSEDIELVKSMMPGVNAFQCDFVNGMDWDQHNKNFSDKLPPELVAVFERNDPIVFYMNPPYKVMEASSSDVGAYMAANGMAKCALDIFHQFMYRMCLLKRFYNLTNVYMGIFGPVTMFHSKMIEPLYNEFKNDFKFQGGMCFSAGDFANTSESVGWIVGYTTWRTKLPGEADDKIVLEAKSIDMQENIHIIGSRLITSIESNLHNWVEPQDVIRRDMMLPQVTTFFNVSDLMIKTPSNAMAYMMSSNYVIRATRRAAVSSLPTPDSIPVTQENFWRCVASFVARRCYANNTNPYNNCQYYSMPETSIEGYNNWLIDALVVFLFDHSAHQSSYRNLEVDGQVWNIPNQLFPLSREQVAGVVTDPTILQDLNTMPAYNEYILNMINQLRPSFSPEAEALFAYACQLILESLSGDTRAKQEYKYWLNAWDAGLAQVRAVDGVLSEDNHTQLGYLLDRLKHKLYAGVYKYGFMMDTAFAVDQGEDEEELEELTEEVTA